MTVFSRNDTRILYIHVPKSGGTSVEFAFRDAGWTLTYRDASHAENWYRKASPQHMHATLLNEIFRLSRFNGKFMTVREPVARFRSEYLMRHERRESFPVNADAVENWAFEQFARQKRDPYHLDNHLRPQTEFYLPGTRVYRLEDGLETMMTDLNQAFGIDGPVKAPHAKAGGTSAGVSSRDVEISPRLRDELYIRYASDYAMFGYEPNGGSS